ncbi:MAG: cobalamin-dependent protein [Sterolibacterium sp.]|nr:cobalamin-dependent protein [Sterolibacterium sp.]
MNAGKGIKVIVTMIGLDGHNTGGEIVAMILRDAGIEVVYLGCNQTPEMIVDAAIQEDVDAIGISSHASNYDQIEEVVKLLRSKNINDVPVICGGNIPVHQAKNLKQNGVAEIFPPGSSSESIINYLVGHTRGASAHAAPKPTAAH